MQLEVRAASGGEVLFRDQLQTAIVDVSVADFRNDGTNQVLVTLANGELCGYITVAMNSLSKAMQDEHDYDLLQQVGMLPGHCLCFMVCLAFSTSYRPVSRTLIASAQNDGCGFTCAWAHAVVDVQVLLLLADDS
jgi:Ciliary BBSome complex subunit 2, C-terminal